MAGPKKKKNQPFKAEKVRSRAEQKTDKKASPKEEQTPEQKRGSRFVISVIAIVALAIIGVYLVREFQPHAVTPEEVIQDQLNTTDAYEYNGYSFIKQDDFWYTKAFINMQTATIRLYYGPRELENFSIHYENNTFSDTLLNTHKVVITIQPDAPNPHYNAVAAASLAETLAKLYATTSVAACQYNGTGCEGRPIVTCNSTDAGVIELQERPGPINITYAGTCLTIAAEGEDLVKAANKVLLGWYGIIK